MGWFQGAGSVSGQEKPAYFQVLSLFFNVSNIDFPKPLKGGGAGPQVPQPQKTRLGRPPVENYKLTIVCKPGCLEWKVGCDLSFFHPDGKRVLNTVLGFMHSFSGDCFTFPHSNVNNIHMI